MTIEWYGIVGRKHAWRWTSPIGEMTVVRKHGDKRYQVKHKGCLIGPTLHQHTRNAQEAAEKYVRERA